jgi:protein-disulfide isomerase-like protein with CxxC motif
MQITAFIDVLSHWCLAATPALEALSATLADDLELEIVIAPLADGAPIGFDPEAERWYYRRGTLAYGTTLTSAWYESREVRTWFANQAVAAAIQLGADPVPLVRRTMGEAMVSGAPLGRESEAVRVVSEIAGLSEANVREQMSRPSLTEALLAGNARLAEIGCGERPSWHLRSATGDFAILQGVWQAEAILPLAQALLADERAYQKAGPPPAFS